MLSTDIKPEYIAPYVFAKAEDLTEFNYCGNRLKYHPSVSIKAFDRSNKLDTISAPLTFSDKYGPYNWDLFIGYTVTKVQLNQICKDANDYLDKKIDWGYEIANGKGPQVFDFDKANGIIMVKKKQITLRDVNYLLDDSDRTEIRKFILMDGTTSLGKRCMENCTELTTVQFCDTLYSINSYCFNNCVNLKDIELPKSLLHISEGAFYNCVSLSKIEIPNSVIKIGAEAFSHCASVTRIVLSKNINTIEYGAFSYLPLVKSIIIPEKVISLGGYIFQSSGVKEIIYLAANSSDIDVAEHSFNDMPNIESFVYCGLSYISKGTDSYIDKKVSVLVDYSYEWGEFLGRTIIRDDVQQTCKEAGELSLKPRKVNKLNRLALSIVLSIIFAASVVVVVVVSMLFCGDRKYKKAKDAEEAESGDFFDILPDDEDNIEDLD